MIALDDYFAGRDRRIDLVKIDTEGAEYAILCGMENLIAENRDRLRLIIEYAPQRFEMSGHNAADMNGKLRALFCRFMLIRETGTSLSEITSDDLDVYCDVAVKQPHSAFTNLLCFASEQSYRAAKAIFAG